MTPVRAAFFWGLTVVRAVFRGFARARRAAARWLNDAPGWQVWPAMFAFWLSTWLGMAVWVLW